MTSPLRQRAVVLQVRAYGDTDAVVPMYGEQSGRFTCFFRGLRNPKKKQQALTLRPGFVLSLELERKPGADLFLAQAVDILTTHLGLADNLARLSALSLVLEAYRDSFREGEADAEAFTLLLSTLDQLAGEAPPLIVTHFSRRLIALLGYESSTTQGATLKQLLATHEQIVGHSLDAYRFFLEIA